MSIYTEAEKAQGLNKRPRTKDELTAGGTGAETLEFRSDFEASRFINDTMGLSEGVDRAIQRNLMERMDDGRFYRVVVKVELTVLAHPYKAEMGERVDFDLLQACCSEPVESSPALLLCEQGDGLVSVLKFEKAQCGLWYRAPVTQEDYERKAKTMDSAHVS